MCDLIFAICDYYISRFLIIRSGWQGKWIILFHRRQIGSTKSLWLLFDLWPLVLWWREEEGGDSKIILEILLQKHYYYAFQKSSLWWRIDMRLFCWLIRGDRRGAVQSLVTHSEAKGWWSKQIERPLMMSVQKYKKIFLNTYL